VIDDNEKEVEGMIEVRRKRRRNKGKEAENTSTFIPSGPSSQPHPIISIPPETSPICGSLDLIFLSYSFHR